MRRLTLTTLAAALCLAVLPAAAAPDAAPLHAALVTFHDEVPAGFVAELAGLGVDDVMVFDAIDTAAVFAPVALLRRLEADPRVAGVRSQRRIVGHLYETVGQIGAQGIENAETYTFGEGAEVEERTRAGVTGAGQTVAVLDTGIYTAHPDLTDRVVEQLHFDYQYAYADLATPEQRDQVAETLGPLSNVDDWGHGTHVAGTVAGTGAMSAGRENHGVAPGADLVDLQIAHVNNGLVDDAGWEANAIAALDWLLRHHDDAAFGEHGIRVVNNSWGLTGTDLIFGEPGYDPLAAIIAEVVDAGIVMVFSAGNDGPGEDTVAAVPNGMDEVISVAAACRPTGGCRPGEVAGFSSRGEAVDIAAPGDTILSAYLPASVVGALGGLGGDYGADPAQEAQNRAFYTSSSGTSMAAPHVAGTVALVLEVHPALTPDQVHEILTTTATDLLEEGVDTASGHGLADVGAALRAANDLRLDAGVARAEAVTP